MIYHHKKWNASETFSVSLKFPSSLSPLLPEIYIKHKIFITPMHSSTNY